MTEQFSNATQTTLTSGIDGSQTTIQAASASGFPSLAQYRILIDAEIMIVTAGTGTTTWTVTRGAEGTSAVPHTNGATIKNILTAAAFGAGIQQAIAAISVKSAPYSATGDGSTDDTAAINSAISAGAGVKSLPPGTYRVATQLVGATGVSLVGAGIGATTILLDDVASDGVSYAGAAATAITLAANLNEFDTTATLSSGGAGFAAGDLVYFTCTSANYGKWVTRVLSVSSNTLTLQEPCPTSMLTANGAQAQRLSTVLRGFRISDLTIKCAVETPTNRTVLLALRECEDATVERVRFENSKDDAIATGACRNLTVRDNVLADSLQNNTALNMEIDGTTGALVTGNEVHNSSSGIILAGSPRSVVSDNRLAGQATSGGRGIKVLQRSNYSRVHDNIVSGFEPTHNNIFVEDSWGCDIHDNEVDNGGGIMLGSALANLDNHDNSIHDNTLRNITGQGINVNLGVSGNTYHSIKGNKIQTCTLAGIEVATSRNEIEGNSIVNFATAGAYGGVAIDSTGTDNTIRGNTIVGDGTKNALLNFGTLRNFWMDNLVPVDGVLLAAADVFKGIESFPSAYVLDTFDRADEGAPPAAQWTNTIYSGEVGMKVVSKRLTTTSGSWSSGYWNAESFSGDVEIFAKIITYQRFYLYVHLANEGTGTLHGYALQATGTQLFVQRIDNAAETTLTSNTSVGPAAGDWVGLRIRGGVLQAWHKPAGRVWRPVTIPIADATYTSGHAGVELSSSNPVLDNVGAG